MARELKYGFAFCVLILSIGVFSAGCATIGGSLETAPSLIPSGKIVYQTTIDRSAPARTEPEPKGGEAALPEDSDVFLEVAGTTTITNLTNNTAEDQSPAVSPDGTTVAFCTNRDGQGFEIYAVKTDGSGLTRLTNDKTDDYSPKWSPDGTRLVFQTFRDGNWEIYQMSANGASQVNLTSNAFADMNPCYSPDGSKIAFQSDRTGRWQIHTMNLDGSGVTNISNNNSNDQTPSWSPFPPNGSGTAPPPPPGAGGPLQTTRIAFESDRNGKWQIFAVAPDGSNIQNLTAGVGADSKQAAWSPDGTMVVFSSSLPGDFDLYVVNASDASGLKRIVSTKFDDLFPTWSK